MATAAASASATTPTAVSAAPAAWGLLAEFAGPEPLVRAAEALRTDGYRAVDAFTPFPVEELARPLALPAPPLGAITAAGGVIGGALGLAVQWYANAVDYPLNVGGRALAAWTAFILPGVLAGVASATLCALLTLLVLCRLPRYHHPVFALDRFSGGTGSGFLLAVEARDARYDPRATRARLEGLDAVWIGEVPQ